MNEKKSKSGARFLPALICLALAGGILLFHLFFPDRGPNRIDPRYLSYLSPETGLLLTTGASPMENLPGAGQLALGRKIDLNRAGQEDLEALPGIGPRLAEKILEDRKKRGTYKRIEELMRVKGIKEKKLAKIRPYLTVGEVEKGGPQGNN